MRLPLERTILMFNTEVLGDARSRVAAEIGVEEDKNSYIRVWPPQI